MEIQTVMVAGNWLDSLDSFIESVTIYCVGEDPCSDVMVYITITDIKLHLIMRFQFWRSEECEIPLFFKVNFDLEWQYLLWYYLWIKLICLKIICIQWDYVQKNHQKKQHKNYKYECTMSAIPSPFGKNNSSWVDTLLKSINQSINTSLWII